LIYDRYFDDLGLQYIFGCEPYSLDDLHAILARKARAGGPQGDLGQVMFMDLSRVDLLKQSEAAFRRFIIRRRALNEKMTQNPICFLVGDIGSFGMMRMYGILAEVSDLRDEDLMLATLDMTEAAHWTAARLGLEDAGALQARLEAEARTAYAAVGNGPKPTCGKS